MPSHTPALCDLVVLDVTLRDGGFHNAWDFAPEQVRAYLHAMDEARIDWAEVGYRSLDRRGFSGALRYSEESHLQDLPHLAHTRLAVMVDAKEFTGQEGALAQLFPPCDQSRVGLVRIAARPKDVRTAIRQVEVLADRGYLTTVNLMAWASLPATDRPELLALLARSRADVTYIADSYGSMHPEEVAEAVRMSKQIAPERAFGVHLHNNLELAFANALAAIREGATWVDASVLGMGRGPGNLKTELLLQHLETRHQHPTYRTGPIYELIGHTWEALKQRYGWGPRAPYILSGHLAVHPTYAQELLESGRYAVPEVTAILHALHQAGTGRSYSQQALDDAISSRPTRMPTRRTARPERDPRPLEPVGDQGLERFRGSWEGREVLVIGRGPSVGQHAGAINRYIKRFSPIVVECNHLGEIDPSRDHLCAFIVLANAQRMVDEVLSRGKAVLIGAARRGLGAASELGDHPIFLEPYEVAAQALSDDPCQIPADVVSMFSIMQAIRLGATRLRVVGFDGYRNSTVAREQRMQRELELFFELLSSRFPGIEVRSLTRTSFDIPETSLYGELALADLAVPPPAERTDPKGLRAISETDLDEPLEDRDDEALGP
jgi:4-hydroxy 2-oxovalerate aldolase